MGAMYHHVKIGTGNMTTKRTTTSAPRGAKAIKETGGHHAISRQLGIEAPNGALSAICLATHWRIVTKGKELEGRGNIAMS